VLVGLPAGTAVAALTTILAVAFGASGWLVGALAGVAFAGAAGTVAVVLATRSTLGAAAAAAESIRAGDFTARLTPAGLAETARLGSAFNAMAKAVEETVAGASQERSRLMAALNSSVDAIIAVDLYGRVTFANDMAGRLLSRDGQALVGSPFAWFVPDDTLVEALRASREERRSLSVTIERPNRQYLQVDTTPILGGGEWASLVVFHDLTEVKRVERVRRDFIANVSHELRTPLAGLKSVIETLEAGAKDDPAVAADFLSRADTEIDRLVQMVEELLELSRLESGDIPLVRRRLDVERILREAVGRLGRQAEKAGVVVGIDVDDGLPPVSGDAEMVERVVVNLLHNAVKFTPAGGRVQLRAACGEGAVEVSVSDTGVGIAEEDLPRIFERFYKGDRSRGAGGTGLGLAVAKHAVEAHGGKIWAESRPGEGSTFRFTIPSDAGQGAM